MAARYPPPEPLDALQRALAISHAQVLAVDTGIDRDAVRRSLNDLINERKHVRDIQGACPPSREYEVNALNERRAELAAQNAAARHELATIESVRGWRHRRGRAARRLVLISQASDDAARLSRFDDALELLRREHHHHTSYVDEHGHELHRLPTIERAIDARLEQLVDADVDNPPPYLRDLGPPPDAPDALSRWRRAAQYVERHRTERGITDLHRPLGPRPEGNRAVVWQVETRQLGSLIAEARGPTQPLDRSIELH